MVLKRPPPHTADFFQWLRQAQTLNERIGRTAHAILDSFETYYLESRGIPQHAKAAFEDGQASESLYLSRRRLHLYSASLRKFSAGLRAAWPGLAGDSQHWRAVEQLYFPEIRGRYEEDLGTAYIHSLRRVFYRDDEWQPVAYSFGKTASPEERSVRHVIAEFPPVEAISPELVEDLLTIPAFSQPLRDAKAHARRICERANARFDLPARGPVVVNALKAGFYRNRGAYVVARAGFADGTGAPLVIALENGPRGIFADALLTREADVHNLFSSTLANFHVTHTRYHELAAFLHLIMPQRALGLQYSTIGFNHVGKVAVMNEVRDELAGHGERLAVAPGFRGSVAIAFTAPSSSYVLKVIRDAPSSHYKWDVFPGRDAVLAKYRRVHEINRTGSMLDNIIYQRIALDGDWFAPELTAELLKHAPGAVSRRGAHLAFSHLIVQMKMSPLPLYLARATRAEGEQAMINLGNCVRNNAAANIFNKDLDARNYGVGRFGKVFLYDYDAVETLTGVKVRTNLDREYGEEDIPEWFFEDGTIFLPEEIEAGLGIDDRNLRRVLRDHHGELLTVDYWQTMQQNLAAGAIPNIRVYPQSERLDAITPQGC